MKIQSAWQSLPLERDFEHIYEDIGAIVKYNVEGKKILQSYNLSLRLLYTTNKQYHFTF